MTAQLVANDDLAIWLGQDVSDLDVPRAERLLRAAQNRVLAHLKADRQNISNVPDVVLDVILGVAARVYRNPSGLTQEMSGQFSAMFGGDTSQAGEIYLSKEDEETLAPYRLKRGMAGMMMLGIDNEVRDESWRYPYGGELGRWGGMYAPSDGGRDLPW